MGEWVLPVEALAGARFTTSAMADGVGALGMLTGTGEPVDPAFAARYGEAFWSMLADHPARAAVVEHCWRPGWMADFLSIPPPAAAATFTAELAQVQTLGDARLRRDLRVSTPTTLPRLLARPGLTDHVTGLLDWIWTGTIAAADWPRRSRVLHADVLARAGALATRGFRGVLKDLGRDREWVHGQLRINRYDRPPKTLPATAELLMIPVHSTASWIGHDGTNRYAIYYPVSGTRIPDQRDRHRALARLVGRNRAHILTSLDQPRSPTALSSDVRLPVGAVGNHLRILFDAGLVARRRTGIHVLYWRTATGDDLIASAN